jgi:hypothetical protein
MAVSYEDLIGLQRFIDFAPSAKMDPYDVAEVGLATLNRSWEASGTRLAHTDSAFFVEEDSLLGPIQIPTQKFGEVILRANVPRAGCIEIDGRLTLALPFFMATILGPAQEIDLESLDDEFESCDTVLPLNVTLERPLFAPVEKLIYSKRDLD